MPIYVKAFYKFISFKLKKFFYPIQFQDKIHCTNFLNKVFYPIQFYPIQFQDKIHCTNFLNKVKA